MKMFENNLRTLTHNSMNRLYCYFCRFVAPSVLGEKKPVKQETIPEKNINYIFLFLLQYLSFRFTLFLFLEKKIDELVKSKFLN